VSVPSVRLSVSSIVSSSNGLDGFAAEVGHRGQQISIDSCCCRATCGPRKVWSDCEEVQRTCFFLTGRLAPTCAVRRVGVVVLVVIQCLCRVGRATSAAGLTCASLPVSRATATQTAKTTSTKATSSAVRLFYLSRVHRRTELN